MILTLAAIGPLLGGLALLLVAGTSMSRHPDFRRSQLTAGLGNIGAALVVLGTIPFAHQRETAVMSWVIIAFLLARTFVNGRLLTRLGKR